MKSCKRIAQEILSSDLAIVSYEDRPTSFVGLKLLILSLEKYSSDIPIYIYIPNKRMTRAMRVWLERRAPQVRIRHIACPSGWSAKPFILREALERYCDAAVWIDADIIVTDNIQKRFVHVPPEEISVATHVGIHNPMRAAVWGYSVCRVLPALVNTCVVRCSKVHLPLLGAWADLTQQPRYLDAQQKPWDERIAAYYGDQDLLEGLLISDALEPAQRPQVDFVAHDHEVFHGTAIPISRLLSPDRKLPLFVHAHGLKPWHLKYIGLPQRQQLKYVALELCLYAWAAQQFADEVDEPDFESWVRPKTQLGITSDLLTRGHPYLRQAPFQLYQTASLRISRLHRTLSAKKPVAC